MQNKYNVRIAWKQYVQMRLNRNAVFEGLGFLLKEISRKILFQLGINDSNIAINYNLYIRAQGDA